MMRLEKGWLWGGVLSAACLLSNSTIARSQDNPLLSPRDSSSEVAFQEANQAVDVDPLLLKVERAIELSKKRYLSAEIHTPWQIAHGILAFRKDFEMKDNGRLVNALDWVSDNAIYKGTPWFEKTRFGGRAQPFTRPYIFQGHPNQFLGYFSLSRLPLDHEFHAGKDVITVKDLVENAKMEVNSREEITWTLWALSHYLPVDAEWQNQHGEHWSIERLVQIQTNESVYNGACGGTHGLFALSYARNKYLYASGGQLRGVWLEADQKIRRYITEARASQNSDGTFSTNYFSGRGHSNDFNQRLATSGHMLEWLMVAVRSDEIRAPWIRNAVDAVCEDLLNSKNQPADVAPLYHAVDALMVYQNRVKPKTDVTVNTPQAAEISPAPLAESANDAGGE